jgi:hypothetical protein
MLSHEASIIATEERAEMKMIEFFIPRKLSFDGAGHSITTRRDIGRAIMRRPAHK